MAVNYRAWTWKQKFSKVFWYIVVILLLLVFVFPLYYTTITAFKPINELTKFPPEFIVRRPTLENFSTLLVAMDGSDVPFVRYLFNSVVSTVGVVVLSTFVCTLGAYGLVKHKVLFGKMWFTLIMIALMFSGMVTSIPSYMVISALGISDTYLVMILPRLASAFNFFLIKQFVEQMPNAYLEAARIDGASEFCIIKKIVFPSLKPAVATLVVFSFINNWNDSNTSLLYITDDSLKSLPYALTLINDGTMAKLGSAGAAAFLMIIPSVIIFLLMQKNVMATMVHSGIK